MPSDHDSLSIATSKLLNTPRSPKLLLFSDSTQPSVLEASPSSTLEIRSREFSPFTPQISQPRQPSPSFNKRKVIDLTISDDDDEPLPVPVRRKKSRSSSEPTSVSAKPKNELDEDDRASRSQDSITTITKPPEIKTVVRKQFFATKSTRVTERRPVFHSSPFLATSQERVSAVDVPPPKPSPAECRRIFLENLRVLNGVTLFNSVDDSSPPITFMFINENVLGKGVQRATDEFMLGCRCRKENGRGVGCEYLSCECLDDSARMEDGRKAFPYSAAKKDSGCLRPFYLQGGYHIFECNDRCNCESNCKNRVVQHGRTVPLEIFKTKNRGWGLRCKVDLKIGQFIDTYRGEIITHEEAERRGSMRNPDQENYLFGFDRWEDESEGYVCDGMFMGGPTRFINHSCDPNCRQMTASYNHADSSIYDIAFFATERIPAGIELTFDYQMGVDEEEDDDEDVEESRRVTEKKADEIEAKKGYRPSKCRCGAKKCRGYFFT